MGKSPDFAVPADPDVVHLEQPREHTAGELTTLIGVEDLWATVAVEGFPHGLQTEVGRQGVGEPPGKDPPREAVDHGEQVEKAPAHRDVPPIFLSEFPGPALISSIRIPHAIEIPAILPGPALQSPQARSSRRFIPAHWICCKTPASGPDSRSTLFL